jgi:cysteine-rich repeat protein
MKVVPAVFVLLGLAACGDNLPAADPDAGPTPDGPPADPCTTLALGPRDFRFDLFGSVVGVEYPVLTPLGGAVPEQLLVELYDSTTGGLPPLAPGTFPLDAAPDDDLRTCQHCVWMPLDWDESGPLTHILYASEGSLTLTAVDDPLSIVFAASTTALVLREATIDDQGNTTFVDGGRCVRIEPLAIDTRPTPGQTCLSAEDCGNPLLEVCSPASGTCTAPECDDFVGCPEGRPVCLSQYGDGLSGACYAACIPGTGTGCGSGETCLQLGVNPTSGICVGNGPGALGDACTVEDISSSCVEGARCSEASGACTGTCPFFADAPGCQGTTECSLFGVCEPPATGDGAAIGQPCGEHAQLADGCAADGDAFRGICFGFEGEPLVCQEACLGVLGCDPAEFCALRFGSGLGICLPDPVCGDGELGEIDEVCDDGNTISGDGCSADCGTVEYGPICAAAPALAPSSTATGDTATAWDGFQASCQLGIARGEVYTFTPPGRGRLRLTVDSERQQVMSLRTTCADGDSELRCAENTSIPTSEIIHQVTNPAQALTVLVSAFTVLEEAPYTLHVEWTAETCGDGVVAGLEVCDDGNTGSGDGCRGDCREIEYAVHCAEADVLAVNSSVAGDLDGAPLLFGATCTNAIYGSGADRLYRITAPSAGTLRVALADASDLMDFAILDGCGLPGSFTELACTASFFPDPLEVPVTAGQVVTVLVEGYSPWINAGTFTLSAELVP